MEPRPPCPSAQSAPRVRVAAMTTWKQASGNPFGPPDDDGYGGLGAAFGAVDPAPAPVDARFTHPAPALAPDARKPAAPSAVPDAFATAPSYDQMFGGAEAPPPTPPEPAAVPQPAPVMPPPMAPAAPAPPMPPAPPPAPATPPAPAFAAATAFPFGAAAESDDAFASTGGDPVKAASTDSVAQPKGSPREVASPPPRTSVFPADVLPRSPRSPRASVFVPAPPGSFSQEKPENETRAPFDDVAAHELLSFRSGPVSEPPRRGSDAVDAVDGVDGHTTKKSYDGSRETTSFDVVADDRRETEEKEKDEASDLSPFLRRRDEPEHLANALLTRDAPRDPRETLRVAAETRTGDESVEALASAAATAASSARRLEARVQELDAELEAYRLGAGDAARALAEKEATVEALRADLAARERTEKEAAAAAAKEERERDAARPRTRLAEVSEKNTSVVEAAHARRLEDRLEKATRALDRERAASAKAEALAAAATRRAAEAESAARATLERAETFERERDRLAFERERDRLIATNGASSRDTNDSSSSPRDSVTVELRVAPDADALLAREAAAARLREEAEAISAASARVVEKLVRENGALVERIERFQAERAPVPRGRREGAGEEEEEEEEEAGFAATGFAYDSKERNEKNAREPAAPAAISVAAPEEEAPNREAPRGLWAFITGADRAPAKYVPRRPNAPVAGGG